MLAGAHWSESSREHQDIAWMAGSLAAPHSSSSASLSELWTMGWASGRGFLICVNQMGRKIRVLPPVWMC